MSQFVTHSSGGLADIITSGYARVNVIDRFPKRGLQPAGAPFTVKVEVQTYGTGAFLRNPFMCLDAFIAVRGLDQYGHKIIGGNLVRTNLTRNCLGEATINLDPIFKPDADSYVQFELYPGGTMEWFTKETTLNDVIAGKVEPIAVSGPMNFALGLDEGKNTGVYAGQTDPWFTVNSGFEFTPILRNAAIIAGAGVAAYLLFLSAPVVRAASEKKARSISDG